MQTFLSVSGLCDASNGHSKQRVSKRLDASQPRPTEQEEIVQEVSD